MNFKIYVEDILETKVNNIKSYNYTKFNKSNYLALIEGHIASKVSQNFLFITTQETLPLIDLRMNEHGRSFFQFIVLGATLGDLEDFSYDFILDYYKESISNEEFKWNMIKYEHALERFKKSHHFSDAETRDMLHDQDELIRIGQLLSEERDRDELIKKILLTAIKITGADAGCVFLVVDRLDGTKGLLFKYSYTFSREIDFNEFIMPMDEKSIAGFCAVNDEVVNIPDVYKIPESATFSFNKSFDENNDYVSRSMLVFPMKNHLGEMQGVIQLINSKENFENSSEDSEIESCEIPLVSKEDFYNKVFPFAFRYEDLMLSVAGQASIALDNIKMIKQLEDQFEGMVRASVDAIDSKDPATSGHSFRVSVMCVRLLKIINRTFNGPFKDFFFTSRDIKQMEYAALLHDYGKVYIDNDIFLKAKKLFPKDFSILMLRLDLIIQTLKAEPYSEKRDEKVKLVSLIRERVMSLNEPRIFHENPKEIIDEILSHSNTLVVYGSDGKIVPILTEDEVTNLQIGRGTLNSREREEIESHVVFSYKFLHSIPWPSDLSRIPEIAGGHHEMLDGSGYPNGLTDKELCLESKIMAIMDIFDALSASDRPYKDAVPFHRVKTILKEEADRGRIDNSLLELFYNNRVYEGLYSSDSDPMNV